METRNVLDADDNVIGTLSLPDGTPEAVWEDKLAEYAEPIETRLWQAIREARQTIFNNTKWIQERHKDQIEREVETSLTEEKYQEWLDYWQELRDLPETYEHPQDVIWPTPPS